jgi:hypothetical protein
VDRLGAGGDCADRRCHRLEHLDDAAAAIDLRLSPDEVAELERPYEPHEVVGFEAAGLPPRS